jgi:hypothetical protein
VESITEIRTLPELLMKPMRSLLKLGLGFIFAGQGA